MKCSYCGHDNFESTYECATCQEPLTPGKGDSERDLAASIRDVPISALNPVPVLSVAPSATVEEVVRLIADRNIGCVLVVENDNVLGIFSERDVLRRIGTQYAQLAQEPISKYMTLAPEMLTMEDSIAFALNRMDINGFRHIPIEQNGRAVGIISIRDVLSYISRQFPELERSDFN